MAQSAKKPIRSTAIRNYCTDCVGDGYPKECDCTTCPLYRYRTGREDKRVSAHGRLPRSGAIRKFCRECVCGSNAEAVKNRCVSPACVLYPFRL